MLFEDFDLKFENLVEKLWDKLEGWFEEAVLTVPNLLVAIIVFILFFLLSRLAEKLSGKLLGRMSQSSVIRRLLKASVVYFILAVGIFVALEILNLGKAVTSLLAGAGIIGLALSFAFQDIAANFVSGILIAISQPFKEGDIIETHKFMGTVTRVNLRATYVETFQGQDVMIPNRMVFENPVIVYTTGYRRIDLEVGVSYGEDLEKVEAVTLNAVDSLDFLARERETRLYYQEFGNSSIDFMIVFWIKYPGVNFFMAKSEAIKSIKAAYHEHGIVIPFPIRTLDFGIKGGKSLHTVINDRFSSNQE